MSPLLDVTDMLTIEIQLSSLSTAVPIHLH